MDKLNFIDGEIGETPVCAENLNIVQDYAEIAINAVQTQVNKLASGSPLKATSTSQMTDTNRIYLLTTDGHWYYYNGTAWTDGGVYQATELANKSVAKAHLTDALAGEIDGKQMQLTAGSNITIDENGLISAEIKTPSTNTETSMYFDNTNTKLVTTAPTTTVEKEITFSTSERSINYVFDVPTDNFVLSPTSLYNLYLVLSGLSTIAGKKYTFKSEWKHDTTIISQSVYTTVEATASTELVGLPMPNNLLEENLVLNIGDTLTLTIYYKTNMGDGTVSILNGTNSQSAFVRNGAEVIANNVYDNFNGGNHSQSYINHYLKEEIGDISTLLDAINGEII